MDTHDNFGHQPVMGLGHNTERMEIPRPDKKKRGGIRKIEGMQPRTEGIPGVEDRRLLALERHIKRKRRRRPYVKKINKLEETCTGHQDQSGANPVKRQQEDTGVFETSGEKCSSDDAGVALGLNKELEENLEERNEMQQDAHFDRLLGHLLARIEVELLQKVEEGLNAQIVEKQVQMEQKEGTDFEEKIGENLNQVHGKDLNSATVPKDAGFVENLGNHNIPMKEKFQNDTLNRSEKMLIETKNDNHVAIAGDVDTRNLEAVQVSEIFCPAQNNWKSMDSEAKLCKLDLQDVVDDDDDDDDDGFMPRKLFFFSFYQFKKGETSTPA